MLFPVKLSCAGGFHCCSLYEYQFLLSCTLNIYTIFYIYFLVAKYVQYELYIVTFYSPIKNVNLHHNFAKVFMIFFIELSAALDLSYLFFFIHP